MFGRMRVAQLVPEYDPAAFVSLGREGKQATGLEHPGGRAAHWRQIREISEGVRRDHQVGAFWLARERLGQIGNEQTAIEILAARLLDHSRRKVDPEHSVATASDC